VAQKDKKFSFQVGRIARFKLFALDQAADTASEQG